MNSFCKIIAVLGIMSGLTITVNAATVERHINYQQMVKMYEHYHGQYDVVMLGDSLTSRGNWQDMFPDVRIGNRGIGGDDTQGILDRLDAVMATGAKKVFIMAGTNDLSHHVDPDTIADNIIQIADRLSENKIMPVVQSTIYSGKNRIGKNPSIKIINDQLEKFCKQKGYEYIDINKIVAPDGYLPDSLTIDGTHLTVKGYSGWVKSINPYL